MVAASSGCAPHRPSFASLALLLHATLCAIQRAPPPPAITRENHASSTHRLRELLILYTSRRAPGAVSHAYT